MKTISILGSTGSIGLSTLDVCRRHPDRFRVVALAAGRNITELAGQAREFIPTLIAVSSPADAVKLKSMVPPEVAVCPGEDGVIACAVLPGVETVVSAIVGAAGLLPTLRAIETGKDIALANKESMVVAGELLQRVAKQSGSRIIPVDSEHSAIFQCLNGEHADDIARLVLTASGGPFWNTPKDMFPFLTKAQALKHPNWSMGEKITVDSATMMNKGLELIEAVHLFDLTEDRIDVVVHPQSVIHSLVEFIDGSVMAELGEPDMRVPIAYALSHPRRIATGTKPLRLIERSQFTFFAPDHARFPCINLARLAARAGGSSPAWLNAANEIAVALFLADRIGFTGIAELVESVMSRHDGGRVNSLQDVLDADARARRIALDIAGHEEWPQKLSAVGEGQ